MNVYSVRLPDEMVAACRDYAQKNLSSDSLSEVIRLALAALLAREVK